MQSRIDTTEETMSRVTIRRAGALPAKIGSDDAMAAKSDAERKADERARMRKLGYVLRQFWVHPHDWPRVKRYLERVNARRDEPGK